MVRVSWFIRSTKALYSSRTPGFRRERKTVISIAVFPRRIIPQRKRRRLSIWRRAVCASSLLFGRRHLGKSGDPRARGTKPLLPARSQLIALTQNADTYRVGRLQAFSHRRRIDRRAAF